jgi:hypothetical protein
MVKITGMVKVAPWQPLAEVLAIETAFGIVTETFVAPAATDTAEAGAKVV